MNNDFTFDFNSLNFSNTPSSGSNGFGDSNFSFPAFGSEFSAPVNNIEANINPSFDSNSSFPTNDTKNDTPIPFDTFGFDKGVSSFDTQFESNKNSFGSFSLEDSNSNLQKTNTPPSNFTTSFDNLGGKDSFSTSSFELPVEKKELSHSNSFSNELSTSLDNAVDFSESSYSKFDSSFDKFNNQFNSDVKLNSPTHFLSDPSLSSSFSSSISSEMTFSTSFDQLEKSNSEVNKQNNYFSSQAWNSPDLSSTEKKYDQFNQSGDDLHFITNEKSKSDSFASNEFLSTFDSPSTSLDHFEQPIVSSLSSLSSSDSSSSFSSKFENSSSTFTSDFDNKLTNNDNHFSPNFNDNFNIDNGNESQSNGLLWVSSINDEPKKDFKTSFDFSAAMDKLDYLENECDPKANSSFPPPDSNLPSFNSINTPINDDNNNNNNNNISFEDSFNLNETSFKPSTEFNTSFDNNNSNKFDQFDSKEGFGDTGQTGKSIDFAPSFDSVGKFDDFGGDSFAKEISFPSSSDRNIDFGTNNDDFKSTSDFNSSFDSKFDQFNANFDDNSFKFEGFDSFGSNNNNNSSNNNDDFGFSANFETSLPSSSSSISSPSNFEFNNDLGKTNDNKFNDFNNFNNNNNINNNETYLKNNENNSSGGLLEIGSKFLLDYLKKELENITAKEEISSSSPLLSATLSEFYSSPNETGIWKGKCNKCNAKRTSNSTLCLICGTSLQSVQNKREIWVSSPATRSHFLLVRSFLFFFFFEIIILLQTNQLHILNFIIHFNFSL